MQGKIPRHALSDEILDGPHSLVQLQAKNRVFAAQSVLKRMLENL